jgi:hypothetical protein
LSLAIILFLAESLKFSIYSQISVLVKLFVRSKHSSLFSQNINDEEKSFVTLTPVACSIKIF